MRLACARNKYDNHAALRWARAEAMSQPRAAARVSTPPRQHREHARIPDWLAQTDALPYREDWKSAIA